MKTNIKVVQNGSKITIRRELHNLIENFNFQIFSGVENSEQKEKGYFSAYKETNKRFYTPFDHALIVIENSQNKFDPRITAQPLGKRIELGLSFIDNILEKRKGSMSVISKPDETIVTMMFPLAKEN